MSAKYSNFFRTVITNAGGISAGATSMTVASVTGMPTLAGSDYCRALIRRASDGARELVKVTAISGLTITMTRAEESTTALAFAAGDRVEIIFSAALLEDLLAEKQAEIDTAIQTANNALATAESAVTTATEALSRLPIVTADITDLAVTTSKIAELAIATSKLADLAVTNAKLAGGITYDKLAGSIPYSKLDPNAVDLLYVISETSATMPSYDAFAGLYWPDIAPAAKAYFGTLWISRTSGTAEVQISCEFSTSSVFSTYNACSYGEISAAFLSAEYITLPIFIPRGCYFRFRATSSGSTAVGWHLSLFTLGY